MTLYEILGGKTILSNEEQVLDPTLKCALLVAVVPDYGFTQYTWQKNSAVWVNLKVPSNTCILYARNCGKYRCLVSGQVYNFNVKGMYGIYNYDYK